MLVYTFESFFSIILNISFATSDGFNRFSVRFQFNFLMNSFICGYIKPDLFIIRAHDIDSIIKNYSKSDIKLII